MSDRPLHPYGFRVVIAVLTQQDPLFLPVGARQQQGIVIEPGTESGLEQGAKVYFEGAVMAIGDSSVIRMDQIVAWEDA